MSGRRDCNQVPNPRPTDALMPFTLRVAMRSVVTAVQRSPAGAGRYGLASSGVFRSSLGTSAGST